MTDRGDCRPGERPRACHSPEPLRPPRVRTSPDPPGGRWATAALQIAAARASRVNGQPVGLVRGVLAERVVISTPADPFLDLRALADYSSLSVRKLRDHLADPLHPLPSYRVGGKVLVRRSDFDAWIERFRHRANADVNQLVKDVLREL